VALAAATGRGCGRLAGAREPVSGLQPEAALRAGPLATPADLLQHTLMHDSDWPDSMWPRWLSVAGVKTEPFKSSLQLQLFNLMIQAAIDGLGVALAQGAAGARRSRSGRARPPSTSTCTSDLLCQRDAQAVDRGLNHQIG